MTGLTSAHARVPWPDVHTSGAAIRPALSRSRVVLRYTMYRTDQRSHRREAWEVFPRWLRHQATASREWVTRSIELNLWVTSTPPPDFVIWVPASGVRP